MSKTPYMFSIAVMGDSHSATRWQDRLCAELAQRDVLFQNGQLRIRDELVGFGHCGEPDASDAGLLPWILGGPRPFVGSAVGVFQWTHSPADNDQAAELVSALVHAARGAVLRAGDLGPRENVVRRKFAVREANSEYGFDSGEALLESVSGAYVDDVVGALRTQLDGAMLEIWLGLDDEAGVGHNPIRVFPPLSRDGSRVPDDLVDETLAPLTVEVWAFRQDIYHSLDTYWSA